MMYTSQDAWDDMLESARDELDCTRTAYDIAQLRLDKITAEYRQWELEQEVSRLQAELAKCQSREMATPSQTPPAIAAVSHVKKRGRTPLSPAIWQQRIAALQAYLAEHPNATDGEVYRTFSHIPQAALHYLLTGKKYSSDPNNYTNLPLDFTPGTLRDVTRQDRAAEALTMPQATFGECIFCCHERGVAIPRGAHRVCEYHRAQAANNADDLSLRDVLIGALDEITDDATAREGAA